MPVANYEIYCKMLDRARAERFAFPAINVTSLTTANAVLRGLAESKSDGIISSVSLVRAVACLLVEACSPGLEISSSNRNEEHGLPASEACSGIIDSFERYNV